MAECLLTDSAKVPAKFPTQAILKADPVTYAELQELAKRAQAYMEEQQRLTYCLDSAAMLALADAFFRHYTRVKKAAIALDYDDLIQNTLALLDHPSLSPWILYKLDGQIDHLLMDEAQDVSLYNGNWQKTVRSVF